MRRKPPPYTTLGRRLWRTTLVCFTFLLKAFGAPLPGQSPLGDFSRASMLVDVKMVS
jgi:hypothetical protein